MELAETGLTAESAALGEMVEDCTARGLDLCQSMTGPGLEAETLRWLPCSFDVLHLFSKAFQFCFHVHHMTRDDGVVGL